MTRRRQQLLVGLLAVATAALGLGVPAIAAEPNLAANPGFEQSTAGWTCTAGGSTVASPVRSGSAALTTTPAGQDNARCSQSVPVKASSSYTLTAWVQGSYTYLGASGTGGTDVSTWSPGSSAWTQLSTSFTTGANTSRVTIYTHGWYGQGAYFVDDVALTGPPGTGDPDPQAPATPGGLSAGSPTSSSISLSWSAVSGAAGYHVYRGGSRVASVTGTSHTDTGLSPSTSYSYQVSAYNTVGESTRSGAVSASTTGGTGNPGGPLPKRILTGYWQNFVNGAANLRIRDIDPQYDLIAIAFADALTTRPGAVGFSVDSGLSSALGGYSDADMIADIAAKKAQGKRFVFSIGGEKGNVDFSNAANIGAFVETMTALIRKFGVDGVDIDLEHGLHAANVANAVRQLRNTFGANFIYTMAPQTLDVQPSGRYMPLIEATKDILTVVHTQYYNSGSMNDCNGGVVHQGNIDFITGQACILLKTLRPDQVALGVPASTSGAGSGYVSPSVVNNAASCLVKLQSCGAFKPGAAAADLRGVMTWSINWDHSNGKQFANTVKPHLNSLG
ncbi:MULTISPECIES: glycoside hydrolase family 18 protein [unclassified Crossiella]|uniref:chitinase n=1 Tax=unclassified Crossiella TaxID=2620835 RepID=UPI001FFF840B|nr:MULTISPECIES: glycoside hydrolase family 18 protein [unclassified Crossiella]MCK2241808.1 glycoside hydrolase family 18 protein [Crossiella sp. S99.2]MCK2255711.1 glycoside hydrolase family 18 protein [Crossiella sp. S99.1]